MIAASSPLTAAILNLLPGLGTGYIYQRRWKAYWVNTLAFFLWVSIDLNRELSIDISDPAVSQ